MSDFDLAHAVDVHTSYATGDLAGLRSLGSRAAARTMIQPVPDYPLDQSGSWSLELLLDATADPDDEFVERLRPGGRDVVWEVTDGALPDGVTLTDAGKLSGRAADIVLPAEGWTDVTLTPAKADGYAGVTLRITWSRSEPPVQALPISAPHLWRGRRWAGMVLGA